MTIALPEDETPGELIKGYFTLMRAFGWDLYVTAHFALRDRLGANWFAARLSELKADDPKNWPPNHRFEPQDPGVILKDYIFESDSPYLDVFGGAFQKMSMAKKILSTRNIWFHFGDDPTTGQLLEAAKIIRAFVHSSAMHMGAKTDALIARLQDLTAGRYPEAAPTVPTTTATSPAQDHAEPAVPDDLPRPPIGGTWLGPIPALRYRLTKTGDVIHPDTLTSVRDRITGDATEKLRAWTAVEPRGRELWIDDDGAVGGFIGASPRLLGYLGPDPEGEIARGFFTPHYYSVDGGEIVDLDTGARLTSPVADSVEPGASLRVTTYGDVIATDDVNGVARVATVTPTEWFPGHLG